MKDEKVKSILWSLESKVEDALKCQPEISRDDVVRILMQIRCELDKLSEVNNG